MSAEEKVSKTETSRQVAGNRSTVRVLSVLSQLATYDGFVGVTQLSNDLGMTKNMVHRALTALVEQSYVVRDLGTLYALGPGVINLQGTQPLEIDVRTICRPFLTELHELTGESVFFSIIVGTNRINTDGIEAQGPRITHVHRGRPLPLHITATGRVLLSYLRDDEVDQYIQAAGPFDRYAEGRVRSAQMLWSEIREIRERGYCVDYTDNVLGVNIAVFAAFPLLDAENRTHGAITVGGPVERFNLTRAQELLPAMQRIVGRAGRMIRSIPADPNFLRAHNA